MRFMSLSLTAAAAALGLGLMVSAPASAQTTELNLCTGGAGGTYIKVGQKMAEIAPMYTMGALTVKVISTGGSIENIQKAARGECDAFLAQGDAMAFAFKQFGAMGITKDRFKVVGPLYQELGILLCHEDSPVDDLDEFDVRHKVATTGMGSGSFATLFNLKQRWPDEYGKVNPLPVGNAFEGVLAVVNGKADCAWSVMAPNSDFLKVVNENPQTRYIIDIGEVDNSDLEDFEIDGKPVYQIVSFDDSGYDNIGVSGSPETLAVQALLVTTADFAASNPQAKSTLDMLLMMGGAEIKRAAYGEDGKPFD